MDQMMPHCNGTYDGGYASSCYDSFPFQEPEYDIPQPVYSNLPESHAGRMCTLPDSPPEFAPDQCTLPYHPDLSPGSYVAPPPYAYNPTGGPGTSGVIPIPRKTFGHLPLRQESFPFAKRLRLDSVDPSGHSSSSASSPFSVKSFKQEEDRDLDFSMSMNTGREGYYQQQTQANQPSSQDESMFSGSMEDGHRNITFKPIFSEQWCQGYQNDFEPASVVEFKVQADKGFNFSQIDDAFICQKKNHFQITVQLQYDRFPHFVKPFPHSEPQAIRGFSVDLFGVKTESIQQTPIKIEQSQSDRTRKPLVPQSIQITQLQHQFTVGRLHFSETTANNMRKKGKPNPDQKFFRLVVALYATIMDQNGVFSRHLLYATGSDNLIVRASNPGQFESDISPVPNWQKAGHEEDAIFHVGNIGINNDRPEEALDVRGNMRLTGRVIQPSDARAKENFELVDQRKQLDNIRRLKIYRYKYKDEFVKALNLTEESTYDTGILAQELLETIPEAVEIVGDLELANGETVENFMMVNKDRLFMENLGAVKELYSLTESYNTRILELERMKRRIAHLAKSDSFRSNVSIVTARSAQSTATARSQPSGLSVSARPSVSYPRPTPCPSGETGGQPKSATPRTFLGKNYIQWLTLTLVMLISICLIAMLALYMTSNSDSLDKNRDPTSLAVHDNDRPVLGHTTVSPDPPWPSSTDSPGPQTFMPVIVPHGDIVWENLWSTGKCQFAFPVAVDKKCIMNTTYAALYCKRSLYMDCCVRNEETPRPNPNRVRYDSLSKAIGNADDHDLNITFFELPEGNKVTGSQLIAAQELQDGKGVLVIPAKRLKKSSQTLRTSGKADDRYNTGDCDMQNPVQQTVDWKLLERIDLVESGLELGQAYCNAHYGSCGANNEYYLSIPISEYYDLPNITVLFQRKENTTFQVCEYRVAESLECRSRSLPPGIACEVDHDEHKVNVPVGSVARTQLRIRVVPTRVAQYFNKPICEVESTDIVKYNLGFVRSCRG